MSAAASHLPLDSAPKDGTIIHVVQEATYRWLPYSENSQQFKVGLIGRWQRFNGKTWQTEELTGSGWRPAETQ